MFLLQTSLIYLSDLPQFFEDGSDMLTQIVRLAGNIFLKLLLCISCWCLLQSKSDWQWRCSDYFLRYIVARLGFKYTSQFNSHMNVWQENIIQNKINQSYNKHGGGLETLKNNRQIFE